MLRYMTWHWGCHSLEWDGRHVETLFQWLGWPCIGVGRVGISGGDIAWWVDINTSFFCSISWIQLKIFLTIALIYFVSNRQRLIGWERTLTSFKNKTSFRSLVRFLIHVVSKKNQRVQRLYLIFASVNFSFTTILYVWQWMVSVATPQ